MRDPNGAPAPGRHFRPGPPTVQAAGSWCLGTCPDCCWKRLVSRSRTGWCRCEGSERGQPAGGGSPHPSLLLSRPAGPTRGPEPFLPAALCYPLCSSVMVAKPFEPDDSLTSPKFPTNSPFYSFPRKPPSPLPGGLQDPHIPNPQTSESIHSDTLNPP